MSVRSLSPLAASKEGVFRVATYNVLSSHLSAPNHFQACSPENLDARARLNKVYKKLTAEVEQESVICLQEVSTTWAGPLHSFFARADYHLVTALYGNRFNGYMGVAVAIPRGKYEIVDVDITRVADTKSLPRSPKPSLLMSYLLQFKQWILSLAQSFKLYTPPFDMWDNALYRHNQMINVRVKERASGAVFVVGNYHMPCMFKHPSVMNVHCALSAQHLQRFAKEDPYVYCGDFNIKPNSSQYELLTKGGIDSKVSLLMI